MANHDQAKSAQRTTMDAIRILAICAALVSVRVSAFAQIPDDKAKKTHEESLAQPTRQVPKSNETSLGLYVTPQEAYEMWKGKPEKVHVLDVRSFEEYVFVGHADMARNIPFIFPQFELPPEDQVQSPPPKGKVPPGCIGVPNPKFVSAVKARYAPADTILVMCGTGGRAAMAVNQLAKAGYSNVYNIINGLEGDRIDDPGSVYNGKRMRNGWKNCGLPWTYDFDSDLMWVAPK